jgi:hypothetical protein
MTNPIFALRRRAAPFQRGDGAQAQPPHSGKARRANGRAHWRAQLSALLPHPEAHDFSDIFAGRGYVEVVINRGSLTR